jgi:DNA-binding NtrC family response regulator
MPEHLPLAEAPITAGGRNRSRTAAAKAASDGDGALDGGDGVAMPSSAGHANGEESPTNGAGANATFKEAVESLEKELIAEALSRNGGNRSKAAEELGIYRRLLYAKMREYGLGE